MSTTATVLASIGTQAEDLVQSAGYVGLAVLTVVEAVFPPIPSELVLPLAGFEVAQGRLGFPGALLAATAGSLIGAWMIDAIGRFGGRPIVLRLYPLLRVSTADLDRGEAWSGGGATGSCSGDGSCPGCAASSRSRPGCSRCRWHGSRCSRPRDPRRGTRR